MSNKEQLTFPFANIRESNPALADSLLETRRVWERAQAEWERAELRKQRAEKEYRRYEEIAIGIGFTPEQIEEAESIEIKQMKAAPRPDVEYRVSNKALMIHIAEVIEAAGHPLTMKEILAALDARGVKLPGLDPRRNLLAYISRSPLVRSIAKGVYDFDRELLRVMRRQQGGDGL